MVVLSDLTVWSLRQSEGPGHMRSHACPVHWKWTLGRPWGDCHFLMVWLKTFFKLCHCICQFSLWVITFINRIQLSKLSATMNRIMQYMKKTKNKKKNCQLWFHFNTNLVVPFQSVVCFCFQTQPVDWMPGRPFFLTGALRY